MRPISKQPSSIASRIQKRIRAKRRGWVFAPRDFLNLGSREAVDAALGRLVATDMIRRIARGVYDYPELHPKFGPRTPSSDAVAVAVARSTGESICHGGARAANMLGVSTQVPAQAVYLTDGTQRDVRVDLGDGRGFDLQFKRSTRRLGGDSRAGLVVRALHFLGKAIDEQTVRRLRTSLTDRDVQDLRALQPRAVGWVRAILDRMLGLDDNGVLAS